MGGVLATHASGPLRFRYGTGRDLLLGARFVQADGTITWGGAKVVKSVTGYDVPKLLVGSLGTLGVLVEATLRLHPMPPATRSWRFGPALLRGRARRSWPRCSTRRSSPIAPRCSTPPGWRRAGLPSDAIGLLLSIGSAAEAVEHQGRALARLAADHGGRSRRGADTAWPASAAWWRPRSCCALAGEPRRLLDWIAEAHGRWPTAREPDVRSWRQPGHGVMQLAVWGGCGAGTRRADLVLPLRAAVEAEGGSLVVERAPVELKTRL